MLEKLIGAPCQLQIIHNGEYANVQAVVPAGKGVPRLMVPEDYVRECDQPGYVSPIAPEETHADDYAPEITDREDIPF